MGRAEGAAAPPKMLKKKNNMKVAKTS